MCQQGLRQQTLEARRVGHRLGLAGRCYGEARGEACGLAGGSCAVAWMGTACGERASVDRKEKRVREWCSLLSRCSVDMFLKVSGQRRAEII